MSDRSWTAPFPRVAAYLDSLPRHIDSFSNCLFKAAGISNDIEKYPFREHLDRLPEGLRDFLTATHSHSEWLPEIYNNVLSMMIRDRYIDNERDWKAWNLDRVQRVTRSPVYRFLFAFTSPRFLMQQTAKRWPMFRQGTSMEIVDPGHDHAVTRLRTPAGLYNDLMLDGWLVALKHLTRIAGGKNVKGEFHTNPSGSRTEFRIRWE